MADQRVENDKQALWKAANELVDSPTEDFSALHGTIVPKLEFLVLELRRSAHDARSLVERAAREASRLERRSAHDDRMIAKLTAKKEARIERERLYDESHASDLTEQDEQAQVGTIDSE